MRAKAISFWGKNNLALTRLILILLNGILCSLAVILGLLAFLYDVEIPIIVKYSLAGLAVLALAIYPSKYAHFNFIKYTFWNRKKMDFALSILGFLLMASVFNHFLYKDFVGNQTEGYAQLVVHQVKTPKEKLKTIMDNIPMLQEYRALKQKIRKEARLLKKELKKTEESNETWKAILLTLIILLGAFLAGALIGALSCSLACNGSEALALIVLVLGWGGVLYLSFIGIRASFRRYNNKQVTNQKSAQEGWEPY